MGGGLDGTVRLNLIMAVIFGSVIMALILLTIPDFCRKDSDVCEDDIDGKLGHKWRFELGRFQRLQPKNGISQVKTTFGVMYNLMLSAGSLIIVLMAIGLTAIIMQSIALSTGCYKDNCYKVTTFVMAVLYVFFVYCIIVLDIWVAILWYTLQSERDAPELGMVDGKKLGKDVTYPQFVRLMLDHTILLLSFPYLAFSLLAFVK